MAFGQLKIFKYQEGKQLVMRSVFGAISSLYLIIGYFSDTFAIPTPILNAVVFSYFLALLLAYFSMYRWPDSFSRRVSSILVDTIASTVVIYYTGGINSPGFLLYVWILTSNAMRFRMREVYVSQYTSLAAYSFILFTHTEALSHPVQVAFQYSTLFIFPLYLHRLIAIQGKARKLAEEASRTKSQFLANMSHELRTPLNAIIGYSELIRDDALKQGHQQYVKDLGHVLSSSNHLLNLINEVLDIAKIESGKMNLHQEEVALKSLLDDITNTVRPNIERNNNIIVTNFVTAPDIFYTDAGKLKQILLNLLSNAAKFTRDGEVHFLVDKKELAGESFVQIEIRDTGIGIEPNQQGAIFEPFVQADNSSTRPYDGSGLGLAITKRFTEMLGGSIDLHSQPNQGSSFTVLLPALAPT